MTIAVSGEAIVQAIPDDWNVTCVGDTSLIEINQDGTGFVPLNSAADGIVDGVIPADIGFNLKLKICQVRFTGLGVISYQGSWR